MQSKKVLPKMFVGIGAFALVGALSLLYRVSKAPLSKLTANEEEEYKLTIDDVTFSGNAFEATTSLGNIVKFSSSGASKGSECAIELSEDGWIVNDGNAQNGLIKGSYTVKAVFEGNLLFASSVGGEHFNEPEALVSGVTTSLRFSSNYVKLIGGEGGANIQSITYKYHCEEATLSPNPIVYLEKDISNGYKNEVVSFSGLRVFDERQPSLGPSDAVITVEDPDSVITTVTTGSYTYAQTGDYQIKISVTNSASKSTNLVRDTHVKEEFVIGWSNHMYSSAISGLTPTIVNDYETYLKANVNFGDVVISKVAFDQTSYPTLASEIEAAGCDILVGFTNTLYDETSGSTAGGNLAYVHRTKKEIAKITTRYISQQVESNLASDAYEVSISDSGVASLDVKKIVIAWFDNAGSTDTRMSNVDTQVEAHLADLGYTIDVTSQKFTRGSKSYDEVHDEIVAAEAVFGLNWGSNFNLSNGFKFLNARMGSGFKFGNQSSRYVTGMIKDGGDYSFYSDLFAYLKSDEMKAIYIA